MNCLSCIHGNMKSNPEHAALGWGQCDNTPVGLFLNLRAPRICVVDRPENETMARTAWLDKADEKRTLSVQQYAKGDSNGL